MSADTRSPHTDALGTLGTIIDHTQKRDAIHLAVLPVVAKGKPLYPGDHVKLVNGEAYWTEVGQGTGIVDPFLTTVVAPGQHFWMVVYPRTITSLRHVWDHPAFPAEAA